MLQLDMVIANLQTLNSCFVMRTKQQNNELMQLADEALQSTKALFVEGCTTDICDSYNGQIAAFGVTIAMSGIKPAMAIYFQQKERTKVKRIKILCVIRYMLSKRGYDYKDVTALFKGIISMSNATQLKTIQTEIINCSIALKQVVRTYNLVSDDGANKGV